MAEGKKKIPVSGWIQMKLENIEGYEIKWQLLCVFARITSRADSFVWPTPDFWCNDAEGS